MASRRTPDAGRRTPDAGHPIRLGGPAEQVDTAKEQCLADVASFAEGRPP